MRRSLAGTLGTLLLTIGLLAACTDEPEVTTLPEVTLSSFDGEGSTTMSELKGPMLVNLFASWCTACRQEMPILEQFHDRYADQVELIGIDHKDPNRAKAEELVADTGVTYPLLDDAAGDLDAAPPFPATRGLPFWAFVDADGTVVHMEYVEITSLDELTGLVEEHLGVVLPAKEAAP